MCGNSPTSQLYGNNILPLYYISSAKHALNLFSGLTRSDVILLSHMYQINSACSFTFISRAIYAVIPFSTFQLSLKRCVHSQFIDREEIGSKVIYRITAKGIDLLMRYNDTLHRMAVEQYNRYH